MPAAPADILPWAIATLGGPAALAQNPLLSLTGDASNRRYFRLQLGAASAIAPAPPGPAGEPTSGVNRSVIVVEAPPTTENNPAFLRVAQLLGKRGVRVPQVLGADIARGYLLLEDLGDQLLLPLLEAQTAESWYRQAGEVLLKLAAPPTLAEGLPAYDEALLSEELDRFRHWFVTALLEISPGDAESRLIAAACRVLLDNALAQPQVLVHRDFHSRNLMLAADGQLAVIDFQDAVHGPITYDLVSLLRDCYIAWPRHLVERWALAHRDLLCQRQLLPPTRDAEFLRWFDLMGLQRHLKVLGTFARLALRDGKTAYLNDLPLVVAYVREVLQVYAKSDSALAAFSEWFDARLVPRIEQEPWSDGCG